MRWPRTLFIDQTGELGGAEFALLDLVQRWDAPCEVLTFVDGPFPQRLRELGVPVSVVKTDLSTVRKESGARHVLGASGAVLRAIREVARRASDFELLYANTQKATIVVAAAAAARRKPFVVHLHDLLVTDHFSTTNLAVALRTLNRATAVIADSEATRRAFVERGGKATLASVVHYGFEPRHTRTTPETRSALGVSSDQFLAGHFSRISPWKGQDVFLEALARTSQVNALIVGDALFGEEDLKADLVATAKRLGVADRVQFLGFRDDIPDLMAACDVTVHSSTSPEPFGRVIVESMLVGTPVIAADAGGPQSIITNDVDGWLCPPGDVGALAGKLGELRANPEVCRERGDTARRSSIERYGMAQYVEGVRTVCANAVRAHS